MPAATYFMSKPDLPIRIKSALIDGMVIIGLMLISAFILNNLNLESGTLRGFIFISILFYEPIMVSLKGTIGQRIMGLRVVKFSEYKKEESKEGINMLFSIIRYLVKVTLGWLSLLTIHSDFYGQAIHDKVGNSIMIIRH